MTTYRTATDADIPAMASLRTETWGEKPYWEKRIAGYLSRESNPQQALAPRVIFVAVEETKIVGLIAGHLTRRYDCDGELEWIDVTTEHRRKGIAAALLKQLAEWFISQKAVHVCVNCSSDNPIAQNFYRSHGVESLNEHWLIWKDISVLLT
jgi:ribosomal protein S18 acetylase RimI-like enzyme